MADIAVGARLFARGEAFDGDALPTAHPLWTLAAYDAEPPPLTLRRFCAWARPGRMPYRGTADEALRAAQLPAEVRRQIGAAIARGQATDRLTIGNDTIRAVSSKTEFDPAQIAMTYGRTLCLGTRVNFKPGHVESANLFQATDTDGRVYSVMVPDACGNVSVIKARGPALPGTGGSGHAARDPLDPGDPGDPGTRTTHTAMTDKPNEVPTPGTFALSVLALGIGAALRRRAHREGAARRPS